MEEPGNLFLFQVGDRVISMNCSKPYPAPNLKALQAKF